MIDKQNPNLIPVLDQFNFAKASANEGANRSYWPFGVGNRRCADEGIAMQFILIWFDVFQNIKFEERNPPGNPNPTHEELLAHFGDVHLAPFTRAINNLYVVQQ